MIIEDKSLTCISVHPDDEIIGCFKLLRDNKIKEIIYIDIQDKRRLFEVENLTKSLSIPFTVLSAAELNKKLNIDDIYLVPSGLDVHPLHRHIHGMTIGLRRGLYTTNMNTEYTKELSESDKKQKKVWLNKYYPSQKSLWESDWKYFLFEGVVFEY